LEEALHIGNCDMLDCIKLLATSYDAMHETDCAIHQYESALLITEDDFNSKAGLTNALSHLHIKVGGQQHGRVDHLEKAINHLEQLLHIQQDSSNIEGKENANALLETMILLGNAMSAKKSFLQAIDWYESALSSNPDKSAIHPTNLRAWYNKGAALLQNRDIVGAVHAFEIILDEVDRNPNAPLSGIAALLNVIGNIYFQSKQFAGAVERFTQILHLKDECLSPRQRAGTLCNIASAHYEMQDYEEAEKTLDEALIVSESLDKKSSGVKATIMCKLAYMLYRRKQYLRAHDLFSDAVSIGDEKCNDESSIKREGYAVACFLKLADKDNELPSSKDENTAGPSSKDENTEGLGGGFDGGIAILKGLSRFLVAAKRPINKEEKSTKYTDDHSASVDNNTTDTNNSIDLSMEEDDHLEKVSTAGTPPAQTRRAIARKPEFEGGLIPVTNDHSTTRYSDVVYPWNVKMLTALGVKSSTCDSIAFSSGDRKVLCNKALEYLLKQTEDCRAKFSSELEGLLVEELNVKFMTMKSLLETEYWCQFGCEVDDDQKHPNRHKY